MHVQKERNKNKDTTLNWEMQSFGSGAEDEASSSSANFY